MPRQDKTCTMEKAAALIKDGARIAFGGFAIYQRPMAFVHELIRQKKKNLTVVGAVNAIEVDMLAGAGCLSGIETSYVGLEKFGLARNFRRKVESGETKVVEYPELLSWDRFKADQEGLPFWTADYLGGSDIVNRNPAIKPFSCPITGKLLWAVPAAKADVVVVHAFAGDKYGNIQIPERHMLPQSIDITLTRGCDTVIVTVEKILDTEVITSKPHLNYIAAFRPACVVEAPYGAHPTAVLGCYHTDRPAFEEYVEAAQAPEKFHDYLEKYVLGTKNHQEYLEKVGRERLQEIRQEGGLL